MGRRLASAVALVVLSACAPTAVEPRCGDAAGGDAVVSVAKEHGADDLVDSARAGDATVFLFTANEVPAAGDSLYVLCRGDSVVEGGYTNDTLFAEGASPAAVRIHASTGGTDAEMIVEPGYVVGWVTDESVRPVVVEWSAGGDRSGEWTIEPGERLFLEPVPTDVPPSATLMYRFVGEDGAVISVDD